MKKRIKKDRLKTLLYNAIVMLEEGFNGCVIGSDLEGELGITEEEYDEVMETDVKLKDFIVNWCKENKYFDEDETLSSRVDTDVAYDMKSDFEKSTLNTCKKFGIDYEVAFDHYYDEIVEEMQPILRRLGATTEF